MKAGVAVVALAIAAIVVWWLLHRRETHPTQAPAAGSAVVTAGGSAAAAERSRVRKLSPEQRRELGDKIAAAVERARAARASSAPGTTTGTAPALPEPPSIPLEEAAKPLQQALQDAIPLLADCFEQHADNRAAAMMTMTSDPELGTVIDTAAITDNDGKPLDPKVDDCLRNAIDSLALPPLGAQAGLLKVQYTFRFDE